MHKIPFEARVPQIIKQLYFVSKKVKLTTFHLALNYARTKFFIFNGYVPGMWNRQMVDTIIKKYKNVSVHAKVANIVPQFCETTENVAYGTTTKVAYQSKHAYVHEEGYPISICKLL